MPIRAGSHDDPCRSNRSRIKKFVRASRHIVVVDTLTDTRIGRRKDLTMAEKTSGLSAEERAAVKQRAAELRAQEKAGKNRAAGEQAI